jgi:preprotein translocase subunit SecE
VQIKDKMKLKTYIQESFTELVHKVTWPTWRELQNSTTVVMIASLIIALTVALMDYGFKTIMAEIYRLLY